MIISGKNVMEEHQAHIVLNDRFVATEWKGDARHNF